MPEASGSRSQPQFFSLAPHLRLKNNSKLPTTRWMRSHSRHKNAWNVAPHTRKWLTVADCGLAEAYNFGLDPSALDGFKSSTPRRNLTVTMLSAPHQENTSSPVQAFSDGVNGASQRSHKRKRPGTDVSSSRAAGTYGRKKAQNAW